MRRSHRLDSANRPVKTASSRTDVHMGLLPGDDHAVTMLDAAHSSTPAAYNARIRRNCRTTGQDPGDSL